MTTLYKITRPDLTTYGGFRYTLQEWTPLLSGEGGLCSPNFYHAYLSPQLALLLNPIHGDYKEPFLLWEAEGEIVARDYELKVGVRRLRLLRQLTVPVVTTEQRVHFALLCALALPQPPAFVTWATGWLAGRDRSAKAARAAEWAAWAELAWAAEAAWRAAAEAAARAAAEAAARAAEAAARAAARAAEAAAEARQFSLLPHAHTALLPWESR